MLLRRREFMKMLGVTAATAGLGACGRNWLVSDRMVQLALRGPGLEREVQTVCGLCEGGCGLTVKLVDDIPVGIKGNPRHPLNRGGICPVGQAGLEVLYAPERLRGPMRRDDGGTLRPAPWEEVLEQIAARLSEVHSGGEPQRFAMLIDAPGRLFYELAERFTQVLGSGSIANPFEAETLPYMLTQGTETVPGFDLAHADLVLSFGLDLFEDGHAPIHAIAATVGTRTTEERVLLLHASSRRSPTASKAAQHVNIRPGTHGALALGMAHVLVREGRYDRRFVAEHTLGFDEWTDDAGQQRLGFRRLLLENYYPDRVAQICGCEPSHVIGFARRFADASAPVAMAGGEAVWGANATWNVIAIHALNALVGAFDRAGGVLLPPPIPFTPLEPVPRTGREELPSVFTSDAAVFASDPIEALAGDGSTTPPVDVLFIVNTNPVYASPAGARLRAALERIPTVVAFAPFADETASVADFILPTNVFLESWHESTTPPSVSVQVLGLAPPVVEPLFDTRHAGDVLLDLAARIGEPAASTLPWRDYPDYLKHRVQGLEKAGQGTVISGSFEESWVRFLEERGWWFLANSGFDKFWEDLVRQAGWWNPAGPRGDVSQLFGTESGRYEFYSRALEKRLVELGTRRGRGQAPLQGAITELGLAASADEVCLPHYEPPAETGAGELSLQLFRPMTARGPLGCVSPMVLEMFGYYTFSGWETWVELSEETAHELDFHDGDHVALESERGSIECVVRIHPGAQPGVAHVPLGLGHRALNEICTGIGSNPTDVVVPARDPLAGTPSLTSTRVQAHLVRRREHGGPPPMHGGH